MYRERLTLLATLGGAGADHSPRGGAPQAYLVRARSRTTRATIYALAFGFLDFGCAGNFWMAYWRGGGIVPGAGVFKRADEEAQLASDSAADQLKMFAASPASRSRRRMGATIAVGVDADAALGDDETDDDDRGLGAREEHSSLLRAGHTLDSATGPASGRGSPLQVKSDGSARFCRKVRCVSFFRTGSPFLLSGIALRPS